MLQLNWTWRSMYHKPTGRNSRGWLTTTTNGKWQMLNEFCYLCYILVEELNKGKATDQGIWWGIFMPLFVVLRLNYLLDRHLICACHDLYASDKSLRLVELIIQCTYQGRWYTIWDNNSLTFRMDAEIQLVNYNCSSSYIDNT